MVFSLRHMFKVFACLHSQANDGTLKKPCATYLRILFSNLTDDRSCFLLQSLIFYLKFPHLNSLVSSFWLVSGNLLEFEASDGRQK